MDKSLTKYAYSLRAKQIEYISTKRIQFMRWPSTGERLDPRCSWQTHQRPKHRQYCNWRTHTDLGIVQPMNISQSVSDDGEYLRVGIICEWMCDLAYSLISSTDFSSFFWRNVWQEACCEGPHLRQTWLLQLWAAWQIDENSGGAAQEERLLRFCSPIKITKRGGIYEFPACKEVRRGINAEIVGKWRKVATQVKALV